MFTAKKVFVVTLLASHRFVAATRVSSCPVQKHTDSYQLFLDNVAPTTLQHSCPISTTPKSLKWLKREERKEYYLTAEEFKNAIENDEVYVVDVREPSEVAQGRVPAKRYVNIPIGVVAMALNCNEEKFEKRFGAPKPNLDEKLVFMCRSGARSTFGLNAAQDMGYENSKHYLGGWNEWESTYPMLKK